MATVTRFVEAGVLDGLRTSLTAQSHADAPRADVIVQLVLAVSALAAKTKKPHAIPAAAVLGPVLTTLNDTMPLCTDGLTCVQFLLDADRTLAPRVAADGGSDLVKMLTSSKPLLRRKSLGILNTLALNAESARVLAQHDCTSTLASFMRVVFGEEEDALLLALRVFSNLLRLCGPGLSKAVLSARDGVVELLDMVAMETQSAEVKGLISKIFAELKATAERKSESTAITDIVTNWNNTDDVTEIVTRFANPPSL
jgi:hypothetical protein